MRFFYSLFSPSEPVRGAAIGDSTTIRRSTVAGRPRTGLFPMLAAGVIAVALGGICWAAVIHEAIDANPVLFLLAVAFACRDLLIWFVPSLGDDAALRLKRRAAGIRAAEAARRKAEEAVTL